MSSETLALRFNELVQKEDLAKRGWIIYGIFKISNCNLIGVIIVHHNNLL